MRLVLRVSRWLAVLGAIEVAAVVIVSLVMVVYPGAFEVTAPVLCPDDRPDAFMVHYSTETADGAGINFTLFCMDDRGQFTEVGSWRPLGLLFAYVSAALLGAALLVGAVGVVRVRGWPRE